MLFILMFLFFVVLNGKLTVEIALVGVVVCALACFLACKVLGWNREKSGKLLRLIPAGLAYIGMVFREIFFANIDVIKIILSPSLKEMKPVLFRINSHLKSDLARTVLADSITITPGTYTVDTDGEILTVHCLGDKFQFFDMELCFNKRLLEIEQRESERDA